MSEENKGFDFTGLSADEDFDSFLESIRRDLDGTPAPRPAAPTAVEDRPEPAEEQEPTEHFSEEEYLKKLGDEALYSKIDL